MAMTYLKVNDAENSNIYTYSRCLEITAIVCGLKSKNLSYPFQLKTSRMLAMLVSRQHTSIHEVKRMMLCVKKTLNAYAVKNFRICVISSCRQACNGAFLSDDVIEHIFPYPVLIEWSWMCISYRKACTLLLRVEWSNSFVGAGGGLDFVVCTSVHASG